ncbi:unnamed protein product [Spirodela intermedia]|uniref:Uncharacterized protein n=1 Tax=Spirodela intermedia TaxID=51605 RepID=A0A7I8IS79_SPIIN|nr:unnamed protein product [Spirodela intermedia]CAA6660866.1 unnamed protein product [Spirodela intermedia]
MKVKKSSGQPSSLMRPVFNLPSAKSRR